MSRIREVGKTDFYEIAQRRASKVSVTAIQAPARCVVDMRIRDPFMPLASLLVFVVLTMAAASFGAMFMPGEWYASLAKPSWTPPGWLFGPVWTVLYIMIAVAGWLVWRAQGLGALTAAWLVQLLLNAIWSYLMFGRNRIDLALADIVLLLGTIALFTAAAWRVSRPAALLFVPYVAWVAFATGLNAAIWRLNP